MSALPSTARPLTIPSPWDASRVHLAILALPVDARAPCYARLAAWLAVALYHTRGAEGDLSQSLAFFAVRAVGGAL